jgi:imidazolonepropionase-like amidohydrolase
MRNGIFLLLLAALPTCSSTTPTDDIVGPTDGQPLAIVNVNVVPMDRDIVLESQTVIVRDGRIVSIGPAGSGAPPTDATVIDGRGGYLMPGLIDMHVHMRSSEAEQYLPHGVTTVRNMWGYSTLGNLVRDIDEGRRKGPRIFSLSSGFDGSPAIWPETQISDDPAAIAPLIDRAYDQGYREVKVYQQLSRASYDTIVAITRRKGMTHAGHRPTAVPLSHVLASGQRSLEHLNGYVGAPDLDARIAATVAAGAYICPTLAIQAMLNPENVTSQHRAVVGAMHRAGVKLLVGSDAGIDRTAAGSSIHDELAMFVSSGVPPYHALLGATKTAAEYLGQSGNIGVVKVGLEADLLLLRSNPLRDIRATRDIRAVINDGRVL